MQDSKLIDCYGKPVGIGNVVRIVKLSREFIEQFQKEEQVLVESMIGQFFKIYGIDEFGQPWVCREWEDERGHLQTHNIALDPEDMERI